MTTSTIQSSTRLPSDSADYSTLLPAAIALALLTPIISIGILLIIGFNRRLRTVNHMLIANTCIWSSFCALVQTNNYIFVLFIDWNTSDVSCRWRAYFAYMTIAGVVYSYLAQAVSRLFFVVFSQQFPWLVSFKAHLVLIAGQWLVSILITLPAIVTEDIFYRVKSLCWVTHLHLTHVVYTFVAYYLVPTLATWLIYMCVYHRVKSSTARTSYQASTQPSNRDLELFRNILILLSIYLSGGLPTTIFIFTKVDFLYPTGIIFILLTVVVEKVATLFLDREIRNATKKMFRRSTSRIAPIFHTAQPTVLAMDRTAQTQIV